MPELDGFQLAAMIRDGRAGGREPVWGADENRDGKTVTDDRSLVQALVASDAFAFRSCRIAFQFHARDLHVRFDRDGDGVAVAAEHRHLDLASELLQLVDGLVLLDRPLGHGLVAGRIAAGVPIEAIQTRLSTIEVPPELLSKGEHYALEVKGDSMIDDGILDGDYVIVERNFYPNNGDVVVALSKSGETRELADVVAYTRRFSIPLIAFTTSRPNQELKNALVFAAVRSWLTGRRLVSLPFSDHFRTPYGNRQRV